MRRTLRLAAAAAFLLSWSGVSADAQAIVSDPSQIRACLCEQEYVLGLQDAMRQQEQVYDGREKALASLNNQVATQRAQMNVYDSSEIDGFKTLLTRRDEAASAFAGPVTDAYNEAVARYNQSVADYNGRCAGRSYDNDVLRQVRATTSCPRP